jgi:hypothetical protein
MTRIQTACYSLIASAFILAGLLAVQLEAPSAEGAMVISQEDFAMMTARTRPDEEALFVLDNSTGRALVYRMDVANRTIKLDDIINLNQWLANNQGGRGNRGR